VLLLMSIYVCKCVRESAFSSWVSLALWRRVHLPSVTSTFPGAGAEEWVLSYPRVFLDSPLPRPDTHSLSGSTLPILPPRRRLCSNGCKRIPRCVCVSVRTVDVTLAGGDLLSRAASICRDASRFSALCCAVTSGTHMNTPPIESHSRALQIDCVT
jgi:hypothetical protein